MARDDLVWSNPAFGTQTYFHDVDENTVALETVQDVGPVIEANKRDLNNVDNRRFGDGKMVARIPIVIMLQLVQQGILDPKFGILDEKRLSAWLNSSENCWMRTWPGNV
jgi:hypothetical protein